MKTAVMTQNAPCLAWWDLTPDDKDTIEDAIWQQLTHRMEDGKYEVGADLPGGRVFFADVEATFYCHTEIGASFMGQYEQVGVTDWVDVSIVIAEIWYEVGGESRKRDVLNQMAPIAEAVARALR